MLPILLILMVVIIFMSTIGTSLTNIANGGYVYYDEAEFQEYANAEYQAAFGSSSAYEDNLLIVFLTNEERDGYYCIAWIGDNVRGDISNMFGDETTEFGRTVHSSINSEYYAYSLGSNLTTVMETMTAKVGGLGLASSFRTPSNHTRMAESKLINRTDLSVSSEIVDSALKEFTAETDIPVVIVVNTMEEVFGKTLTATDIFTIIMLIGLLVLAIWMIVRTVKNNKKKDGNNNGNNNNNDNNRYNNGGSGHYQRNY